MDARYLPLLLNVREITVENYDPLEVIQAFWIKYGVNYSRLHVLNLFLSYKGETELQEELNEEEMEQFSRDVMALFMAYYIVHQEKIMPEDIQIPVEEVPEKNEEEKFYSEILYTMLGLRDFEQKLNR
ncbi:hypothetical protein H8B06_11855 [Sphingobacterium sp. DN00404]|uniref:Uncharacterized protein n=1 Tax=Sphingobacterium micropteri TaxID=2763501 RepID=A0ABR7YQB9_9SPHI|nr:hypothetical protein [Sphingobacterium micropteri]MBD1433526.1 hypothetical protein [Sphingobacterium micropteri]